MSLMAKNTDPWVVFAQSKFQERFSSFEQAYRYAVGRFGSGEYLIRDLTAAEPFVPMVFVHQ